jgi:hypothetical protein
VIKTRDFAGLGAALEVKSRRYNLPGFETDLMAVYPQYLASMARKAAAYEIFAPLSSRNAIEVLNPVTGGTEAAYLLKRGFKDQFPAAWKIVQRVDKLYKAQLSKADRDAIKGLSPEAKRVMDITKKQLGYIETGGKGAQRAAKAAQLNIPTKLGLSQITQISQFGYPQIAAGFRGSFDDIMRAVKRDPEVEYFVMESGAIIEQIIREHEMALMGGMSRSTQQTLQEIGFTRMDVMARVVGGIRGASMAQHASDEMMKIFKKTTKTPKDAKRLKDLEKQFMLLDIDPAAVAANAGALTRDDLLRASQTMSTDFNFWSDTLRLPHFFKSPWGRFFTQFKTFSYQHSRNMGKHVLNPIKEDGNYKPLIRAMIAMGIAGEVINDARALARWRKRDTKGFDRFWENILAAGGIGIMYDAINSTQYRGGPVNFALGPTATTVGDAIQSIHWGPRAQARFGLKNLAVINPLLPTGYLGYTPIMSQFLQERMKKDATPLTEFPLGPVEEK